MALKRTRRPFWGKWESNAERTASLLDKIGKQEEAKVLRAKIDNRMKKKQERAA